jgi:hypothetical protein
MIFRIAIMLSPVLLPRHKIRGTPRDVKRSSYDILFAALAVIAANASNVSPQGVYCNNSLIGAWR